MGQGGTPTPTAALYGTSTIGDPSTATNQLYPYPEVVLSLPVVTTNTAGSYYPSAAHLVVSYPPQKLVVRNVFEEKHFGRHSIVTFTKNATSSTSPCAPASTACTVTIDLVAPRNATLASGGSENPVQLLGISFSLRNPFGSTGGVAATSDFTVNSVALYDGNGALQIQDPTQVTVVGIR
jgi:hypothetical protein